jgi:hypothetical protein
MNGVFFTLTISEGRVYLNTLGFIFALGFILILSAESKFHLVATKLSVLGFF